MNLRQIHQFIALAEIKHFRKAADHIGLTQSALTQAISKLETDLDLQLFIRGNTGSTLTEHGQRLYDHAKVITGQIEAAENELKVRAQQLEAEIRIGVVQSLGDEILIKAISPFKAQYPAYNVKIIKEWSADLALLLEEGEIDFAFLSDHFLPSEIPEIKRDLLFKSNVQVVVSERHDLYKRKSLTLADLMDKQWVAVSTNPRWPEFLARVFTSADLMPPHQVVRTNSMTLATSLIALGEAVGIVSPTLYDSSQHTNAIKYFDVPELRRERSFSLCRRARMVVRPINQYFIEEFRRTILRELKITQSD